MHTSAGYARTRLPSTPPRPLGAPGKAARASVEPIPAIMSAVRVPDDAVLVSIHAAAFMVRVHP
eukprot:1756021-Alexandrium_andersonii.AAC.1